MTHRRQFTVLLRRSSSVFPSLQFPLGSSFRLPSRTACVFSVPSSVSQPRHFFVRPTNVVHSFLHPTSVHDQLRHHMAMLMRPRVVGLPSQYRLGSNHTPSFNSSHSCLAAHFFQWTILACFNSIFFTSCGQTTLISTATCSSNSKLHHSAQWLPRSRVSHMTVSAGPLTRFHLCTSKICFLHTFSCSLLHQPIHTPSARKSVAMVDISSSTSNSFTCKKRGNETNYFLPAAAAFNFNLSVGGMPKACFSSHSRWNQNPPSTTTSHQSAVSRQTLDPSFPQLHATYRNPSRTCGWSTTSRQQPRARGTISPKMITDVNR